MGLSTWRKVLNTAQIKNDYAEQPAGLKWRSNTLFILGTVGIGLFTDLFLYGLIVPVLPFMLAERVGVPESQIQSYTSGMLAAYAGSSVVFSPLSGILADKVSTRQAPFLLGLTTLLAATILLFLGKTIPILVVARILQGISSAFVWTIGLAMCIETVGPENLGKTVGSMFSFISAGSIWAPFIGGVLYEKVGYSGVMWVAFAVLALDFIMRIFVIEKKVARKYGLEDPSNAAADEEQQTDGAADEHDGEQQPLLGRDKDEDEDFRLPDQPSKFVQTIPILPCLKNSGLLTALLLALVQAILIGSFDATVPTVSQELFNFDSFKAGILFLPLGLVDVIFSPVAGWCVDRYGTKIVAVISFIFLVPVFVLLRLPHAGGMDQILLYGTLVGLSGIALSGAGSPSIVEAGNVVQKYHKANPKFFGEQGPYASLYGMNSMMFNLGLTIGPELAGEMKQLIGYGNMNAILAGICAITAVMSFLYIGGKPKVLKGKTK